MLVYFMTFGLILRPFGIFCAYLVYFVPIWYIFGNLAHVVPRKIWQPCYFYKTFVRACKQVGDETTLSKKPSTNHTIIALANGG
jgi:hypothetical protein